MPRKLLVIDDEASITKIIQKIAASIGYEVLALNTPAAAVETFISFRPDVMMLDLIMPGLDGIDILRQVLKLRTDTRVIVMSGFGRGYLRLAQAVAEFDHHFSLAELPKPFRRQDVLSLLQDRSRTDQIAASPIVGRTILTGTAAA